MLTARMCAAQLNVKLIHATTPTLWILLEYVGHRKNAKDQCVKLLSVWSCAIVCHISTGLNQSYESEASGSSFEETNKRIYHALRHFHW